MELIRIEWNAKLSLVMDERSNYGDGESEVKSQLSQSKTLIHRHLSSSQFVNK